MTIRRSRSSMTGKQLRQRLKRQQQRKLKTGRLLNLEKLEERQLLTTGPQLIGIQPNDGALLQNGDTRTNSPTDLTFNFQDNAMIDPTTLSGIQLTRSGLDGVFSAASVTSDLNTNGEVVFEFTARALGQGGNGVELNFTKADRGSNTPPLVEVEDRTIDIELNSHFGSATTAFELITVINNNPEAANLITARIARGAPDANVGSPAINYSPLVLEGANSASVTSDFNVGTFFFELKFVATQPGSAGNGIQINVTSSDRGSAGPLVTTSERTISLVMNSNPAFPTRAIDIVNAINNDPDASALVTASVPIGSSSTVVGNRPINFSPLILSGASDEIIQPGAFFVEDGGRQVVMRFAETLPDDVYRVDIFGSGAQSLENTQGEAFNGGENFSLEFDLNLGPQVVSIVPQPIERSLSGDLVQQTDQIVVYFNNDDLDRASAENPAFYKLLLTRDTVENTDDVEFTPVQVQYDRDADRAVLRFADPLDELIDPTTGGAIGSGTFRLRIGTDEPAPLPPLTSTPNLEPGSSYDTAMSVGTSLVIDAAGDAFVEGQTFVLTNDSGTPQTFEFDRGFVLQMPSQGGMVGGIGDDETFTITNGTVTVIFEFDNNGLFVDGDNDTVPDNELITFTGSESPQAMARLVRDAINAVPSLQLTALDLPGGRVHLGGTTDHTLNTDSTTITQTGTPGAQTAGAVAVTFVNDPSFTIDDVANSVAAAINGSGLGIQAEAQGGSLTGHVALTSVQQVVLDSSLTAMRHELLHGVVISSEIVVDHRFALQFPGASDEPGHRDITAQSHVTRAPDTDAEIATRFYNFQDVYGADPFGNPLHNAITENQKARTREIFEFLGYYLGIQFIESSNLGYTIVTGDMRAIDPTVVTGPGGVLGLSAASPDGTQGTAILDLQENWDDSFGAAENPANPSWFINAMQQIGTLLGMGATTELPGLTIHGSEPALAFGNVPEAIFPGDHDVTHGQLLYRPDNTDIDLYKFELAEDGQFSAETFAERQDNTSLLDTAITLYRDVVDVDGNVTGREVVARNDDYYSEDSFLELPLTAGRYYLGVSASGNNIYDPTIEDSGLGGTSQGTYQLRMNFRPNADNSIVDATGQALDGDGDGLAGGVNNFWFRSVSEANTIFVDKANTPGPGDGSPDNPFNTIKAALAVAQPGEIVRIVGNGGADGNIATPEDNLAYEIGFSRVNGIALADGSTLAVPDGVTVMIDAGTIIKLRRARIGVGSSSPVINRSGGALQVLGTPLFVNGGSVVTDATGEAIPGSVILTSIHDADNGVDTNPDTRPPAPTGGDWGGIVFRNDIDRADRNRPDLESDGIFLNYVNNADIRYGGGSVVVDGLPQIIAPIHMTDARPTVSFNSITLSADAALSANPDSFEETNFHAPPFQAIPFTSDYDRVGPHVRSNRILDNSLNGMFVRIATPAGGELQQLTVSGRWDDSDVVHVVAENLVVASQPGGPVLETDAPAVSLVTLTPLSGGNLAADAYNYRLVFVDRAGNEGPPSTATRTITLTDPNGTVRLNNLPSAGSGFIARRLYRSAPGGAGPYTLVAEINPSSTSYVDTGDTRGGILREFFDDANNPFELRPRLDARLAIDPGVVVKLEGSRIETGIGAQLIAEGQDGHEVIFTSVQDDRFGAGGTFNTTSDISTIPVVAQKGDWGGIYVGHLGTVSLDHGVVAYAGGVTKVEGTFAGFNALEVHQADARIAHTEFENNADGMGGQAGPERLGRGTHESAAIFIRGAQPIVVGNIIHDNDGPALNINANSLNHVIVEDIGRSTYRQTGGLNDLTSPLDRVTDFSGNKGPLLRENRIGDNDINGLVVRGDTLTTQGVWDDTDLVHVVDDETIYVSDLHTFGGLRLESNANESLVVKLRGANAGFTAVGRPLDIDDRIGGSVQVIGQPRSPVVMTSLSDCTVGAGLTPDGRPNHDTLSSGQCQPGNESSPFADVIVIMDESGSMSFAQVFSVGLVASLDATLIANGIGDGTAGINQFGLVGFGSGTTNARALPVGSMGELFGTSTEYATAAGNLLTNGAVEDGWEAIDFTLDTYTYRPEAAKFAILVTDEPRSDIDSSNTFGSILAGLNAAGVILEGILGVSIVDGAGTQAVALDSNGIAFLEDGMGGFTTSPGGTIQFSFGNIVPDYVDLAFATGGIVGDISQIQAGGATAASFGNAMIASILGQAGGNAARPGDWRGIDLEQYANDRNVDVTSEREPLDISEGPDANLVPDEAQFLGDLATDELSGDDNLRLGFEVHGVINRPADVDTYSFSAVAGTEVWLDIDRTDHALDSVIELIDADGTILAQSDDSLAESLDSSLLYHSSELPANHVNILQKSAFAPRDFYGTNPRDAGMRVVLPGTPGKVNTYQIRVRSSNLSPGAPRSDLQDLTKLSGGLTSGQYQLQVRLQEEDEFPGSTVQYADIRFATRAIRVDGLPLHSPLAGEGGEDPNAQNGVFGGAQVQNLGNLLNSDRAALSFAGNIGDGGLNANDVDFVNFDVIYDSVVSATGTFPAIFDIDYADGLARANTRLSVFDANGNLILTSKDSNIAEDRPGPLQGTDLDDLSRGTVGALDPFIGTVELPLGSYSVAITSEAQVPQELEQFLIANPNNPLIRLEPVDSSLRIAEDRIDSIGGTTAAGPVTPVLFDQDSFTPFNLGDLVLMVSTDTGLSQTTITTVDPFTGAIETVIGSFAEDTGDIALRPDGELFSFTLDVEDAFSSDVESGNYLQIDTGNASIVNLGDDGIETFNVDPANPPTAIRSNPVGGTRVGHGIQFDAITFGPGPNPLNLYAVGGRPDFVQANPGAQAPGVPVLANALYRFDRNTGIASSAAQPDRTGNARTNGAGTQIVERGELVTDADLNGTARSILIGADATLVDPSSNLATFNIRDADVFSIDHDGLAITPAINFEFNSGPEVRFQHNPSAGIFVRDGDQFQLDSLPFEFNTGSVVVVTAVTGNAINDDDRLILTDNQGVTRTFEFDRDNNVSGNNVAIPFTFGMNQLSLVNQIVSVINAEPGFAIQATPLAGSNRITLTGDSVTQQANFQRFGTNGPGISIFGDPNSSATATIQVEETFTSAELAAAIETAFAGVPAITASTRGDRLNFSGARFGDFVDVAARGVFTDIGSDGIFVSGNNPINFLAADTAVDIAGRITAALNSFVPTPPDMQQITATQTGKVVELAPPSLVETVNPPLQIAGSAPGGEITGIAFVGTQMYAVSDAGGFYAVNGEDTPNATTDYIETSAADLQGINFQGLVAGPTNTESGQFANLLFGIDSNGEIFAFDTAGQLQPVFADGQTSIQTGLANVTGLSFSTLDRNLWSVTSDRDTDPGHGVNAAFDGSRLVDTEGGLSLHFGRGQNSTYDLPGGAHGSVESAAFSLEGYSPADEPVLYFNYYLDTENAQSLLTNSAMRDAFRVFVGTPDGQWHLAATNNSARGPGSFDDEYDFLGSIDVDVQELFDVGDNGAPDSWRQARVPLAPFAGQSDLRLRFDFSTAGDLNTGDLFTAGEELRSIDASLLRDGDTFEIDGLDTFEIDLGYTLISPSGAEIQDGQSFNIDGQPFEFDNNGVLSAPSGVIGVTFSAQQSAARVAASIEQAILENFSSPIRTPDISVTAERNDTLDRATVSRLTGGFEIMRSQSQGEIGDNPNLVVDQGLDVDLLRMELNARDNVRIDIDTAAGSSLLDSYVRLFDAAGNELAFSDDGAAPGEASSADSYIDFTVPSAGTYYVGISGSGNNAYDPTVEGSGVSASTGKYSIEIIVTNDGGVTRRDGNRLTLPDADNVSISQGNPLILDGAPGTVGRSVSIHPGMDDVEVASVIRQSLADRYSRGDIRVIKQFDETLRIINHTVTDPGPFGLTQFNVWDLFGNFNSNQRGQDNAHEGVYVDDVMIGFAERGEMATGAVGDSTFVANSLLPANQILVGPYDLEIRPGESYGTQDPVTGALILERTFDTNDRLTQQHTLLGTRADQIADGQTFQLSDGVDSLTFEFEDVNIGDGVASGNVEIPFNPSLNDSTPESAAVIAARIRDAINSDEVQAVLEITAALSDGSVTAASTDIRIDLFGNVLTDLLSPTVVISGVPDTGNDLRDVLLGMSPSLIPVGDAILTGSATSTGFFEGGFSSIGLESGIILTTGDVFNAAGPNMDDGFSGLASGMGDADLDAEFGFQTLDSSVLEFVVDIPAGGDIRFDFVFASEEYNEFANLGFNDVFGFFVDGQNIALLPGTNTPISIATVNGGGPTLGANPSNPQFFHNNDPDENGGFLAELGYDGFTDVFTAEAQGLTPGQHTIRLAISDVLDDQFDSAVFVQPFGVTTPDSVNRIAGIRHNATGDTNHKREQGQLILHSNVIRNASQVGIDVGPGNRNNLGLGVPLAGVLPHPGPVRNLRELNTDNLLPGVVVKNNLVISSGNTGIRFAGEATVAGEVGPVPFGRIINNTVVGGPIGVAVADNASPTLLNNIVANTGVGIDVDATSETTIIGGTLYVGNTVDFSNANVGEGDSAIFVATAAEVFVDPLTGNFYPVQGSPAIDSAIDSLEDRDTMTRVKNPLGLDPSPVLAPERDALGQARVDDPDVDTPSGQGANVFKDRGAIDRADFIGPSVILVDPRDNDAVGTDLDPRETFVEVNAILDTFSIKILDGVEPNDPTNGTGVNDLSVDRSKLTLLRDGERLVEGIDFRFAYDSTANVIHLTSLANVWERDRSYEIKLANTDGFVITAPLVTDVADGDQFVITDLIGNVETFEFETGYTMQVPATLRLLLPETGGAAIEDGETFIVDNGVSSVVFEFDSNDVVASNNEIIEFTDIDDVDVLAAAVVQALTDADIQLSPVNLGDGEVHMGSLAIHSVDVSQTVVGISGVPGGVADGDTFTIDDGVDSFITFEFDSDQTQNDPDSRVITFSASETHEQLAAKIVASISTAGVNLIPVHLGDGLIQVGGSTLHTLDTSNSAIIQNGTPGVQGEFALKVPTQAGLPIGILDQDSFIISNGTTTRTFEFDSDGFGTPGNRIIRFEDDDTLDELVAAIILQLNAANLGLDPVHTGGGVIELGGLATTTLDLSQSVLTQIGNPGVPAAQPIAIIPDEDIFTPEVMAGAIADVINDSEVLTSVTADARDDEVFVLGVESIVGIENTSIPGIEDLAGNAMKPNRLNGETAFTIFVGKGVDYGDAPDPTFPTLQDNGGAGHEVVPGFSLGDLIDSEFDGQPSAQADGDGTDDDGVRFITSIHPAFDAELEVTARGVAANRPAFLDAWIDFNRNGIWETNEKIVDSEPLVAGTNFFTVSVPQAASVGTAMARFRMSSTGNLGTTGLASDGEVEDYAFSIVQNPWQNSPNRFDVDDDGIVAPSDVLKIVNDLNNNGSRRLTVPPNFTPPPYLDVNGDGFVSPADANGVIGVINAGASGEGEAVAAADRGEGEAGAFQAFVTAPQGPLTSPEPTPEPVVRRGSREVRFDLLPRATENDLQRLAAAQQAAASPWDRTLDVLAKDAATDDDAHDSFFADF